MVNVKNNLINLKFNRLTVLEQDKNDYIVPSNGKRYAKWICKCDCGNIISVLGSQLKSGKTKSCGCYNIDCIIERNKKGKNNNKYIEMEDYFIGYTNKGEEFKIDKDDYCYCREHTWWTNREGYLETRINGERHFMHRIITNCPHDKIVDHINHIVCDNRKVNLRIVTPSQNTMNTKVRSDNNCNIKGVHRRKDCDRWESHIYKDGKAYYLGLFKTKEEAIEARNKAEKELFGEYSYSKEKDNRFTYMVQD